MQVAVKLGAVTVDITTYASWFRSSTPYIQAHRGKTFVVHLPARAQEQDNLVNIVHDLALLQVLGVRMLVILDPTPDPDNSPDSPAGMANGYERLQTMFGAGLPNTPLHGADIATARIECFSDLRAPLESQLGNIDVATSAINQVLEQGKIAIAVVPETDVAATAQANLGQPQPTAGSNELAPNQRLVLALVQALAADKLIVLAEHGRLPDGELLTSSIMTPDDVAAYVAHSAVGMRLKHQLLAAASAVRSGIPRAHIVSDSDNGALLGELFTSTGHGTQISEPTQSPIRAATASDIPGIMQLVEPLIARGALVPRSADTVASSIEEFIVVELDGVVIGCCALHPYTSENTAELACVAVHDSYRQSHQRQHASIGTRLLAYAENHAKQMGVKQLFALTTGPVRWFVAHGFTEANVNNLPAGKRERYDHARNPVVLTKQL